DRVPDAHEKHLEPAYNPRHSRVRGLDGHENVVSWNDRTLGNRANADRKVTIEIQNDVLEAIEREGLTVGGEEPCGLVQHPNQNGLGEILFQKILETKEDRLVVLAATGLQVGEQRRYSGRILLEVARLV